MNQENGYSLVKGSVVKDYTVSFPIKKGSNAETYRVKELEKVVLKDF